jgi:hypothetical protein
MSNRNSRHGVASIWRLETSASRWSGPRMASQQLATTCSAHS